MGCSGRGGAKLESRHMWQAAAEGMDPSVCSAPKAVVPGPFAVTRLQTFAQVRRQLLTCLLRVENRY